MFVLHILQVAYTFDAGPNACLFLLESDLPIVASLINHVFPPENKNINYFKGMETPLVSLPQVRLYFSLTVKALSSKGIYNILLIHSQVRQ